MIPIKILNKTDYIKVKFLEFVSKKYSIITDKNRYKILSIRVNS